MAPQRKSFSQESDILGILLNAIFPGWPLGFPFQMEKYFPVVLLS
jgi:hypothetical protein